MRMKNCGWKNADDKMWMAKCGWKNTDGQLSIACVAGVKRGGGRGGGREDKNPMREKLTYDVS